MLVRHFGHGVGHLKYERQQEGDTKMVPRGDDDGNTDSDHTSESQVSDSEREEDVQDSSDDTEIEGDPVANTDDSSDGASEEIEESESDSTCNSEDDGGYASL
jgi:hypothetical protein